MWEEPEFFSPEDMFCCPHLTICTEPGSCAHAYALANDMECDTSPVPSIDAKTPDNRHVSGPYSYIITQDGEALICEYNGQEAVVHIPATLGGYPVRELLRYSFYGNDFLEEVIVPEGVESIAPLAFQDCPSLRRVHLPDSLKALGDFAFADCRDLEHINLPPQLESIMLATFHGCHRLREVTLPAGLRNIFPMAFGNCKALETLHLSPALETVMASAFTGCPHLRIAGALPATLDEKSREVLSKLTR